MKSHIVTSLLLFSGCLWICPSIAHAGDYVIVPGQRIGSVDLGMTSSIVHRLMHSPQRTRRLSSGIVQEIWLSPLSPQFLSDEKKNGRYLKWNSLSVYFKSEKVIQVEVSSARFTTKERLSTASAPTSLRRHFKPFRTSYFEYRNPDPGGIPGAKHFVWYDDATARGIAWRYGAWGGLSPDPDLDRGPLEAIVVHAPNHRLIPDATGAVEMFQIR